MVPISVRILYCGKTRIVSFRLDICFIFYSQYCYNFLRYFLLDGPKAARKYLSDKHLDCLRVPKLKLLQRNECPHFFKAFEIKKFQYYDISSVSNICDNNRDNN